MNIQQDAHLTYCTNIHPGESWNETFDALKINIPEVRKKLHKASFGIGLRLSELASVQLLNDSNLEIFRQWMEEERLYVFTLNGFPYGNFHHERVKENVHRPDWLSTDRVDYTLRLARILGELLPSNQEGGISTSPISYRFWHRDLNKVMEESVYSFMKIVEGLDRIHAETGKYIHLDIEPEPDGVLENTDEFVCFFNDYLLSKGSQYLRKSGQKNPEEQIRRHIQMCYDVCHFAVEFEDGSEVVDRVHSEGILIGKMQISAALQGDLSEDGEEIYRLLSEFNEETYLHQAVVRSGTEFHKYRDLNEVLAEKPGGDEIRSHFHVPIFINHYGKLESTQDEILKVLHKWNEHSFTRHLEVETYTWTVLPDELRQNLPESIARELQWVLDEIK
jgi:hypothetical protein